MGREYKLHWSAHPCCRQLMHELVLRRRLQMLDNDPFLHPGASRAFWLPWGDYFYMLLTKIAKPGFHSKKDWHFEWRITDSTMLLLRGFTVSKSPCVVEYNLLHCHIQRNHHKLLIIGIGTDGLRNSSCLYSALPLWGFLKVGSIALCIILHNAVQWTVLM